MTPERWQRISHIFDAARRRDVGDRAAFLAEACAGDDDLRREVESLLASHDRASRFIEEPAMAVAVELAAGENGVALSGQEIAHYRVSSLLGAGGMGEVYLAEDTRLGRQVALKLLSNYFTEDAERVRRFRLEARSASALNHPNILTIYEIGCVDSRHYIATEYIEGATLRERMNNSRMDLAEALDIADQVTAALIAAHRAGIVHRDIKPENVMVRRDGYVKVLDFGLAKMTETKAPATASDPEAPTVVQLNTNPGTIMGTPRYMSPEQVRGLRVDARTDLWSLGCVLYEMIAGAVPFDGETPGDLIAAILRNDPAPISHYKPEAPAGLQRIVSKALSKDREGRYQSAQDLAVDLRRLSRQLESESEPERSAQLEPSGGAAAKTERAAVENVGVMSVGRRRSRKTINSLAVLPLANASAQPETDYLSDGITESLINALSQLPRLRVTTRATVFSYKGRDIEPRKVGRELGVRAVLTGRVAQSGERLIIGTELVDVADGSQLWGARYSRPLSDIFSVQEEVAKEITENLRLKLTGEEKKRLVKRHTNSAEAYHLYLKGRYFWDKRTSEGAKRGIEYFRQAIEEDPSYALAYAGMADCYILLSYGKFGNLPPKEAFSRAKSAARKALEIDDTLAEAHTSLAYIKHEYDWDWAGAERGFKRAIKLNPNYATAHSWYGNFLSAMGRHEEAIAESKRAQGLDPLSLILNANVGHTFYFARQYDQAIERQQETLEIDPNFALSHWFLGLNYIRKGMYEEAIAGFQKAITLTGGGSTWTPGLGYAYAMSGRGAEAQGVLKDLQDQLTGKYVSPVDIALIYVGLGERDQALHWLEKGYQERNDNMAYLNVESIWDSLRSDPRFADLLRRIGFDSADVNVPAAPSYTAPHSAPPSPKRRSRKAIDSVANPSLVNASDNPQAECLSSISSSPQSHMPPPRLPPNNLTESLSPLIGREKEIAGIQSMLRREDVRLLTMTGAGGTGKTRLAQEVARRMLEEFSDGVFFVELAAVSDPQLVASSIAQPLGVKEEGGKPLVDVLKDYLHGKQMLLVIDNFEQVLAAAPLAAELLAASPQTKILITSRALLHLSAEREFVVPPLTAPSQELFGDELLARADGADLLGELQKYEAVRLFVERARSVKPSFALTAENARSVAGICARLDGLPLAIELAAARVKILSPPSILSRLGNRLKLLTGGAQDLPARQQTMRGAVEWSYDLLTEDEKRLFRRLAVFAGGFTFEAAEAVVQRNDNSANEDLAALPPDVRKASGFPPSQPLDSASGSAASLEAQPQEIKEADFSERRSPSVYQAAEPLIECQSKIESPPPAGGPPNDVDVLDLLTSLVGKSLLVTKEQPGGDVRFRMLEVVREYALESLAATNEAEATRRRHAAYFLALGEAAEPRLQTAQAAEWLNRLEEEHDNLRAALRWSLERDAQIAARLATAIQNFWITHGHLTEGRRWSGATLERSGDAPALARSKLLNVSGRMAHHQGDYQSARELFEECLAAGREAGDGRQVALASKGLGMVALEEGDFGAARVFFGKSLATSREVGDEKIIAFSLASLGELTRAEGDYTTARQLYEESLSLIKQVGYTLGLIASFNNLGAIAYFEGDYRAARSYYVEALATARELGHKISISWSLDGFAALAAKGGDAERAARLAGAAEALRESIDYKADIADRRFRDAYLLELRAALSEADFSAAYEQGRKMNLGEAMALALAEAAP